MAVNLATKYEGIVDERFVTGSLTDGAVGTDYTFEGAKTVCVYAVPTVELTDYQRAGSNRYGVPAELDNTIQELTMSQDKAFTFTIDRGNYADTMMAMHAGRALARQIDEVILPEIDSYRLSSMAAGAGSYGIQELTSEDAYDALLAASEALCNAHAPLEGRVVFASPGFCRLLMQDTGFIKTGDLAQDLVMNGQIGMVDGLSIIRVPAAYLPSGVSFVVTHPAATAAPKKLADYKIHDNPPGINGWLIEGRLYHDCFVLKNKAGAVYAHFGALGQLKAGLSGESGAAVVECKRNGNTRYSIDAEAPKLGEDLSGWMQLGAEGLVELTEGQTLRVAWADAENRCLAVSEALQL